MNKLRLLRLNMPAKNVLKNYIPGGYYHLYLRGVEKRKIFLDEQDYSVFLSYLKTYLTPKNTDRLQEGLSSKNINWKEKDKILKMLRLNNFSEQITLLSYCLMPNHFHLLIKQKSKDSINYFMRSLNTRYVYYFNKKYKRVGPLYQDTYKAVIVKSDEQLIHLTLYIHLNPQDNLSQVSRGVSLLRLTSQPSSLPEYLGTRKTNWVNIKEVLNLISKTKYHEKYNILVQKYKTPSPTIANLTIE